jgi:hypothetical protein
VTTRRVALAALALCAAAVADAAASGQTSPAPGGGGSSSDDDGRFFPTRPRDAALSTQEGVLVGSVKIWGRPMIACPELIGPADA